MAVASKVDSNVTGSRFAEEDSLGVLGGSPIWFPLEPNSYDNFGGQISTIARNPINAGRQRQKGVVSDLDASGGLNTDLTHGNLQRLLRGFFFAQYREKADTNPFNGTKVSLTSVDGVAEAYQAASGLDIFAAGDVVVAEGFGENANNGMKTVASATATDLTVNEDLLAEASPPAAGRIIKVGHQFADGDVTVDASASLPKLVFASGDPASLGIIPGEWVFVGGDTTATQFATTANNGFARVKAVTAGAGGSITLDKTQNQMVTEASTTGITLQVFVGRVIRNEAATNLQKRFSYQIERTLGSPDDANTQLQAEYLVGSIANELTFNFQQADKVNCDLSFVAIDNEQHTQAEGVKAGTRPALVSGDAYNTSSDFARLKMSILDPTTANPTKLFGFVTDFTLPINNNVSPNKAIGVLGAFDVTAGDFTVDGSMEAYFSTVEAVQAIRNNSDVTLDFTLVKNNKGITADVPLIALGDGRPTVEKDAPIKLPLEVGAAADRVYNHTLLMVFWDYLPDAAA